MKQADGIWLPEADVHFKEMMRREPTRDYRGRRVGVYQFGKISRAIAHAKRRRVALDVGAHVGFWSMWLAESFERIHAFEPVPEHAECWRRNLAGIQNATLREAAVGRECGRAGLAVERANSGLSHVSGGDDVEMVAIDALVVGAVDLIKIDTEGFESAVLDGAIETIRRNLPVIVVETNGQHARYGHAEPVKLLQGMGAVVLDRMRHDVIMGWPDAL